MSNENETKQLSRMDKVLELKERIEKDMWLLKSLIKVGEITGFAMMFGLFGEHPSVYRHGVWLAVICMFLDFVLNYNDYITHKRFERIGECHG